MGAHRVRSAFARLSALVALILAVTAVPIHSRICDDLDGDGYLAGPDCASQDDRNDQNPPIHPAAPAVCNGWDDDCDRDADEGCERTCPDFGIARRVLLNESAVEPQHRDRRSRLGGWYSKTTSKTEQAMPGA